MVAGGVLLLTGVPRIGKTTVIRRVADRLKEKRLGGFYTEEIRGHGGRRGFRLVGFDGTERIIAHVDFPKVHRVGKYGVDVEAIDGAGDRLGLDRLRSILSMKSARWSACRTALSVGCGLSLPDRVRSSRPLPCTVAALSKRSNEGEAPLFGKSPMRTARNFLCRSWGG